MKKFFIIHGACPNVLKSVFSSSYHVQTPGVDLVEDVFLKPRIYSFEEQKTQIFKDLNRISVLNHPAHLFRDVLEVPNHHYNQGDLESAICPSLLFQSHREYFTFHAPGEGSPLPDASEKHSIRLSYRDKDNTLCAFSIVRHPEIRDLWAISATRNPHLPPEKQDMLVIASTQLFLPEAQPGIALLHPEEITVHLKQFMRLGDKLPLLADLIQNNGEINRHLFDDLYDKYEHKKKWHTKQFKNYEQYDSHFQKFREEHAELLEEDDKAVHDYQLEQRRLTQFKGKQKEIIDELEQLRAESEARRARYTEIASKPFKHAILCGLLLSPLFFTPLFLFTLLPLTVALAATALSSLAVMVTYGTLTHRAQARLFHEQEQAAQTESQQLQAQLRDKLQKIEELEQLQENATQDIYKRQGELHALYVNEELNSLLPDEPETGEQKEDKPACSPAHVGFFAPEPEVAFSSAAHSNPQHTFQ